MQKSKNLRIAIVTESKEGSASIMIPELCKEFKTEIVGVIHCQKAIKNKKKYYKTKFKKVLKIGISGALLGMYMRKWYGTDLKNYLTIKPLDVVTHELSLPYYKTVGLNSLETRKLLSSLEVDLAISMGCSYISSNIFNIPKFGMINTHHELLPEYQNAQSIIWPLYNNSKSTGYSVHKITKIIDDGPILYRKERDIIFKDTLGETVSFNYANSIIDSSNGIIYAIKMLLNGEFVNQTSSFKGRKGHYTTPSIFSFLKIYKNWSNMKKKVS